MAFYFTLATAERTRIESVKIGMAGVGGLGSNCLAHLVRSGVRKFVIADFDVVSESNLNRQFYFANQIGQLKIHAIAENLRKISPDLELGLHPVRITTDNATSLFGDCDIIVEALDNPEAKSMLIQTLLPLGRPIVAASGMAGWGKSNTMQVRRVGKNLYLAGDLTSGISETNPPLSPRVGIAAALQANTVMALILGVDI